MGSRPPNRWPCGVGDTGSVRGSGSSDDEAEDALEIVDIGKVDRDPAALCAHRDPYPRFEVIAEQLLQFEQMKIVYSKYSIT